MLTFIVNPAAGSGYATRTEAEIRTFMQSQDTPWQILHTEHPGHATELAQQAAQDGAEGVVAVGGDGTCFEVACGLMDSGVPMGIIPSGTGNDFIKTAGISKKPMEALKLILTGRRKTVDVGRLNDRMFLNVCGTGFDVQVLDHMTVAKKYARGILPYLIGLIKAIFFYKPVHVRFMADGREQERDVLICSVANGRFIGGGIPICPDARPDDGMLDMVVVETRPRWQIPFYLPGLMMGKVCNFRITTHIRCKAAQIISKGMRLNVDGEIIPMDQADFTILPGKLQLFC